ncbi:MAG: T9SS type A sorting domain-containing protein [Bacteroidales bacterium]|nr:T9SS type A sorting domain-containing protein [Bacteroidales bacterium]
MKRLFFLCIQILSFLFVNSQIIYEHTYNGYASLVNLSNSGYKYYVQDTENKELRLYNIDHSIWKTVNIEVPAGYELSWVYNVSEMLFSTDGLIGFSYSYFQTTPTYNYQSRIMNENGTILLTIPNAVSAFAVSGGEYGAKLLANITDYSTNNTTTKVYDLPGEFVSIPNKLQDINPEHPYPNPSSSIITIPYNLPDGIDKGEIIIYNTIGREILKYNVDKTFKNVIINTNTLYKGIYYYNLITKESKSKITKLIIQ